MLFAEASRAADGVKGWLTVDEQTVLYDVARLVPPGGTIVELGSWMGRSSIVLAGASLSGPRATVYAVDLFSEIKDVNATEYAPHLDADESDYFPTFDRNIRAAGVEAVVVPVRGMTVDAAREWAGPAIDFLFIDADHSYEGVRGDFLAWAPLCKPNAWCAFHDYFNFAKPGVRRFVDVLLKAGVVTDLRLSGSILCGRLPAVDRAAIDKAIAGPHLATPLPADVLARWYEMEVGGGWLAFQKQGRREALAHAFRAARLAPFRADAWRLAACAAVKPRGAAS